MQRLVRFGLLASLFVGTGLSFGCHDDDHRHVREHRVIVERHDHDRRDWDHRDRDHHDHDHDRDRHNRHHD